MRFLARIFALFAVVLWSLPAAALQVNGLGMPVNGNPVPNLFFSAQPSLQSQFSQTMFLGLNAGAAFSLPSENGYGSTGIGNGALQSMTAANAENAALGVWAGQYCTTCSGMTAIGMHALGSETVAPGMTAIGNDANRDAISSGGGGFATAVGAAAIAHGAPGTGVTGIGASAMRGNAAAVLIGGTKTTSDQITVTLSASGSTPGSVTNLPLSKVYTVGAGDTIATIASGLQALFGTQTVINGQSYFVQSFSTSFSDGTAALYFAFPGTTTTGWALTLASSCTGTCTETLTNETGANFTSSTGIGNKALQGLGAAAPSGDTAVGDSAMRDVVSGSSDVAVGVSAGQVLTTGNDDAIVGFQAGLAITTGSTDTLMGFRAGDHITGGQGITAVGSQAGLLVTGNSNTIMGNNVASGTLTSGTNNLILGTSSSCDTAAGGTGNTIQLCAGSTAIFSATGAGTPSTSASAVAGTFGETGITTDSGQTATATVCEDTTTHVFYFGSGAAGICKGTSSLRFKENVAPLNHGLSDLMQLDTIAYNYKPNIGLDSSRRLYGFSAEQMQTVLPELVYSDAQGPTSIDWAGVVPILVHAIQEQQREIEQLRADR